MRKKVLRQGDVVLVPRASLPDGVEAVGDELAVRGEGEHTHRLPALVYRLRGDAEDSEGRQRERVFVVVDDALALMTHEEHPPLAVPRGVYEVRQARRYLPPTSAGRARAWGD